MKTELAVTLVNKGNGDVALGIGEATLIMRAEVAVRILLDKLLHSPAPSPVTLPAIGAKWQEGIYAGLSIEDEKPVALVLLPGDESLKWDEGVAWAKKQGGVLPSRIDQLVLFKNLKSEFQGTWYWSGEQSAGVSGYAWCQFFGNGNQHYGHKDTDSRVRAVRRLPIQ